jgi:hypothetical protein
LNIDLENKRRSDALAGEDRIKRNEIFGADDLNKNPVPKSNVMKDDFGWEVPVETVPLPSNGVVYPSDSPLHGLEMLDIKAMTAREEDILTSRALIKKGTVITHLLDSCITTPNVTSSDLIVGDRNAIMIAIRITGYGSDYGADVTCPECATRQSKRFDLAELPIKRLNIKPVAKGQNEFAFILPVTQKKVTFKFLTGADEEQISTESGRRRKLMPEIQTDNLVTNRLEKTIVSVEGVTDKVKLNSFVRQMPALDSRRLRTYMDDAEPGMDMRVTLECDSCGDSSQVSLPIGAGFFWPRD